ncbi:uncharacterized protein LOC126896515 isoform X2 [Daktulosphaira vitifoliae]|uniref:uncharacterized protein LOC126896515 isoform X2 n=1 Tax=Daktulosphaira vitifoliae TaxID=58002 RepID=UPI0021AAB681|nr:uncharacterized protein LOC126896515 isoform X2 [Daktulosphaira vitifoliae]
MIKTSLLLLSVFILLTETTMNSRRNTDIYNSLIKNYGWKDLKDVKYVKYRLKYYILQNHLEAATLLTCNQGVRVLTVMLACSYAKYINILSLLFIQFGEYCKSLINKRNPLLNEYGCTIELMKILQKIPSLATLMKETLLVLDYLHTNPKKNNLVFYNFLLYLEECNSILKDNILKENELSTIATIFKHIDSFFNFIHVNIKEDSSTYCQFEQFDIASIWEKWDEEYKYKNNIDETFQFYHYLSQKINLIIHSIIMNLFHNLGFQYDRKTLQIGIPLPNKYITADLAFFKRHNETSENNQSEYEIKEIKHHLENQWILELIASLNNELNNVFNTNEELQFIDFLGQELNNVSQTNEELQLINFLEREVNNVPQTNKDLQIINNPEQGLKNDDSCEDILETMDTDENIEDYIKFF